MLPRSINGVFIILAAVLVLVTGSVVFAQKSDNSAGKGSADGVSSGKIGISDAGPMSPYARPNVGTGIGDGGFSQQRPPSMVDIPSEPRTKRQSPSSTARGNNGPPGPIPNIVPDPKKVPKKTPVTSPGTDPIQYVPEGDQSTNGSPGPIPNIVPDPKKVPKKAPINRSPGTDPIQYTSTDQPNRSPGPIPNIVPDPRKVPLKRPMNSGPDPSTDRSYNGSPGPIPNIVPDPKKVPEPVKRPGVPPGPIPNIVPPTERHAAPVVVVTDKYAPKS